jgi:hypothetical protein
MRDPYGSTWKRLDLSIFRYTPTALRLALQSPSEVNFIKEAIMRHRLLVALVLTCAFTGTVCG